MGAARHAHHRQTDKLDAAVVDALADDKRRARRRGASISD